MEIDYLHKYKKYKIKYLKLYQKMRLGQNKNLIGGSKNMYETDFPKTNMNTPTYNNFNHVGCNALTILKSNSHYNLGRLIGKVQNKRSKPKISKSIEHDRDRYTKQYALYQKYYPELLESFRGLAEKIELNTERYIYSNIVTTPPHSGCSVVSYNNLIGRNYDWERDSIRAEELFQVEVEGFNKFVAINNPYMPDGHDNEYVIDGKNEKRNNVFVKNYVTNIGDGVDFINDKFLYIGLLWMNYSGEKKDGLMIIHFMRKMAETCGNVHDVEEFLKIIPCETPKFIFVADTEGNQIVIEHYTGLNYVIVRPTDGLLIHTNHILDEEHIKYDNKKHMKESIKRYNIIRDKCLEFKPTNLLEIKTVMDNVFGEYKNRPSTIHQLFMNLPEKKVYYLTKYKIYNLHELLI